MCGSLRFVGYTPTVRFFFGRFVVHFQNPSNEGFLNWGIPKSPEVPILKWSSMTWMVWGPPYFKKAPNALLGGELPTNPFSRLVHPTVISVN